MKFIIIAQPKSASTSFLKTMGELMGVSYGQQVTDGNRLVRGLASTPARRVVLKSANRLLAFAGLRLVQTKRSSTESVRLRDDFPALDYPLMSSMHVDICDFTEGSTGFSSLYELQKQHFPPTKGNLLAFRGVPKVVLIRDVEATLDAYLRMTSLPGYFRFMIVKNASFRHALMDELATWQEGWRREVEAHGGLVLTFEDITQRTPSSVCAALETFGLSDKNVDLDSIQLAKERFTGGAKS